MYYFVLQGRVLINLLTYLLTGSIQTSALSSATLGKLFTHIAPVTKQYNLVAA